MGFIQDSYKRWKAGKWICVSYLLSFVSGWLMRQMIQGKIKSEDKAALFILLATVLTLVVVLCTVGLRRWRKGVLGTAEKCLMTFSLVIYPLSFVLGWFTDIH